MASPSPRGKPEVNEAPPTYDDWLKALEAAVGCKPTNYELEEPFTAGQEWKGALYGWDVREGVDPPPLEKLVEMWIEEREDEGEDLQDMLDEVLDPDELGGDDADVVDEEAINSLALQTCW